MALACCGVCAGKIPEAAAAAWSAWPAGDTPAAAPSAHPAACCLLVPAAAGALLARPMSLQFRQVKVLGMLSILCWGPGKQKLWQPAFRSLQGVAVNMNQQCEEGNVHLVGPS